MRKYFYFKMKGDGSNDGEMKDRQCTMHDFHRHK